VDRPVYIDRPIRTPVFQSVARNFGGCAVPSAPVTVSAPAYGHGAGCSGHGFGRHGFGSAYGTSSSYNVPSSHTAPVVSGGYEYHGSGASLGGYGSGLSLGGSWGAQDCCSGYTGGVSTGGVSYGGHDFGGHPKQAFEHISDRISKISARIADGQNSGAITAAEAASLRTKIQKVSKELTSARKDGRFEEKEIEIVAASVRQLAEQMKVAKRNEEIVSQYAQGHHAVGGFGHHGITAAHIRPHYGAASAYLPSAQFPALQQALPFAYGWGGGNAGFGSF